MTLREKKQRTNPQSFLEWGGEGAGGPPLSLMIPWLAYGTALHEFKFSVAVSTHPIKMRTIPCQFAVKNENTDFLRLPDGFSHRNACQKKKKDNKCNLFLAIKFPLALRNLK